MAELLQIDRAYLSRIENGHAEPSLRLIKLAETVKKEHGLLSVESLQLTHIPSTSQAFGVTVSEDGSQYGKASATEQLAIYFQVWIEAARNNPDVAPYALGVLRKHLPHSDIDELFK